jgi:cyclophilin family peptidyl-prolyl cis-trans isomerase
MRRRLAIVAALALALAGCASEVPPTPTVTCPTGPPTLAAAQAILLDAAQATVTVSGAVSGEFTFELHGDAAPVATANFVSLARCGFYDGIWFHRILAGFVVQAGDPGTKSHSGDFEELGTGGPGFGFEVEPPADGLSYDPYSVSMANNQRTGNGSQFFIAVADLDSGLPRDYTIFGTVVSGTDVIDAIAAVPVNDPRVGVPLSLVTIEGIEITSDGGSMTLDRVPKRFAL